MNLEKASVRLAYMLRHSREPVYVSMDGGWAKVDTVIKALKEQFPEMNRDYLEQMVAMDKKGRYAFDSTGVLIRANQGHSIPGVEVEMQRMVPPSILYHGTATRFLPAIMTEGLKPMSRQFVHISAAYETAVNVGKRHGEPVVLTVLAGQMAADGYAFFCSANGVWQTKEVPVKYLSLG